MLNGKSPVRNMGPVNGAGNAEAQHQNNQELF